MPDTLPCPQLTKLTSLSGTFSVPINYLVLDFTTAYMPRSLRRLLLYYTVQDHPTMLPVTPGWPAGGLVPPEIEQLALERGPCPTLPTVHEVHLSNLSMVPDFPARFPNVERAVFGDRIEANPPALPPLAELAACARLTRLCLCCEIYHAFSPAHTLDHLSRLSALCHLELHGFERYSNPAGGFQNKPPRPFAEFEGAVRAPALTRLTLYNPKDVPAWRQGPTPEWLRDRAAAAAALRRCAAAGERLQVEFVCDDAWQPSLLLD